MYPFHPGSVQSHGATAELRTPMFIVVNLRAKGMIHKAKDTARFLHRDKRKTICGWRAGGAVSSVRFCATNVWPVPGFKGRICLKCFPGKPLETGVATAVAARQANNNAIHECKD